MYLSFKSKYTGGRIMKVAQYTKPLTVALRPEVFDQIKDISDEMQISMAEWVRHVLERALKNAKTKGEK